MAIDASVPPPSTAAASADHVTPLVAQRQFAQALPGKVGKQKVSDLEAAEKRAKRESERRKTPEAKAVVALRTSSAAYKAAAKRSRANPKAKAAAAQRKSSDAYKSARNMRRASAKAKAAVAERLGAWQLDSSTPLLPSA
jgi:hypothetical protein